MRRETHATCDLPTCGGDARQGRGGRARHAGREGRTPAYLSVVILVLGSSPRMTTVRVDDDAGEPTANDAAEKRTTPGKKSPHSHPRPPDPCHHRPVPSSDTPQGVAARRDRRRAWRKDARLHGRGPRKMASLRRRGRERRRRTGRLFPCPHRAPGVPVRHTGWRDSAVWRPGVCKDPVRAARVEDGADRQSWLRHREPEYVHDALPEEGHATVPTNPAIAERPKSRIKTAERGAGRRHIPLLLRGNFQRPVRVRKAHGQTTGDEPREGKGVPMTIACPFDSNLVEAGLPCHFRGRMRGHE
jgi:hypothetical protein